MGSVDIVPRFEGGIPDIKREEESSDEDGDNEAIDTEQDQVRLLILLIFSWVLLPMEKKP